MKKILILVTVIFPLLFSCSKKKVVVEPIYTLVEFDHLAHAASPSNEKGEYALKLSDYALGVNPLESKGLSYEHLPFFAVSFDKVETARSEAKRLNQYYSRNWLFDRVEGEPILEDYVISTFQAANPNRKIQRVPKAHAPAHGGAHGDSHGAPAAH